MNTNHSLHHLRPGPACPRFEYLLSKDSLGLLEPEEAQQIQAHLATCAYCHGRQAEYKQLDAAFRRHFAQNATSLRTEEIISALRAREGVYVRDAQVPLSGAAPLELPRQTSPKLQPPSGRALRRVFPSWAAAVAAVLIVALITAGLVVSRHFVLPNTGQGPAPSTHISTTPTPNPARTDPYPPYTGTLVWNDSLKDNKQGHNWAEIDRGIGNGCRFSAGSYQVVNAPFDSYSCLEGSINFIYFTLQVNVSFVESSSPQDQAGIIFGRVYNASGSEFVLSLSADGHYALGACAAQDYPGECSRTLFQGTCQNCRMGAGQSNTIAIVVDQDIIMFYANGQEQAWAHDSTYDPGLIGFYGKADTATSIIAYQNLKIWEL